MTVDASEEEEGLHFATVAVQKNIRSAESLYEKNLCCENVCNLFNETSWRKLCQIQIYRSFPLVNLFRQ